MKGKYREKERRESVVGECCMVVEMQKREGCGFKAWWEGERSGAEGMKGKGRRKHGCHEQ